nr:hypothetical protein Iba_chr10dCG11750 [Ipomoea batatas]GME07748.1 hypothetical protein Iba_scaffold6481CG0100 [Ipomoea batatas]
MRTLGKLVWRFRREWVFASKARGDESLGGKRGRTIGGRGRRDSLVTVAITSTILLRWQRWEEEKCVVVIVTRREPKTANDVVPAEHNSERKEQSLLDVSVLDQQPAEQTVFLVEVMQLTVEARRCHHCHLHQCPLKYNTGTEYVGEYYKMLEYG